MILVDISVLIDYLKGNIKGLQLAFLISQCKPFLFFIQIIIALLSFSQ